MHCYTVSSQITICHITFDDIHFETLSNALLHITVSPELFPRRPLFGFEEKTRILISPLTWSVRMISIQN
jgi:hypothetical protein